MKECIILGSGNAFNSDKRGHCCFLLDEIFLIDCGPTVLLKREEFNVDFSKIKMVLVTHFHGDHFSGLPFLVLYFQFILNRKEILYILGPRGIQNQYNALLNLVYPNMQINFPLEFIEIHDSYSFEEYYIKAIPMLHKEESVGYRINDSIHTFAFTGDTKWNESIITLFDDVDVAIIELSFKKKILDSSHLSLEELKQNREKIKAKRLFFNHLYDELSREVEILNTMNSGFGIPLYDGYKIYFES